MGTSEDFLKELQMQFSRHLTAFSGLTQKANSMITVSSIVATLLMGFNTFIYQNVKVNDNPILVIVIMVGILAMLTTVILAVISNRVVSQTFPIVSKKFYEDNKKNYETIKDSLTNIKDKDVFYSSFIDAYLDSINDLEPKLDRKSKFIKFCEISFFVGLSSIPIILGIVYQTELIKLLNQIQF